ncbi:MAG TPA: CPBP family intramembrane glutamic endopeptidase [Candidatus Limnocylindrales bacterium]|nr:CPBP family intramembrane glutamic endopeptidase [Candidatus Limnocylindrales bacterium]
MENDLRVLVGLGLTLLLVMLRVEAERFGAAEYDEPVRGRRPSIIRRLAWYILGVGGVLALMFVHPSPELDLNLTVGDRSGILLAVVIAGIGVGQAVALAYLHYRRLRFPDFGAYPGALANEILTAFIDEAVFRGAVIGYFLWAMAGTASAGSAASLAILGSTVIYALATRLGAPGRDRYMLLLAVLIGLVGGWATLETGGIGAAFLGHAITRVAVFLTTGHAGQPPARGTEDEDVEKRRRTPEGWRAVDHRGGVRER